MNAGEKRINSIEGLRGCAAIIVAYFYHYKNEFGGNIPTPDILQNDKIIWLYQRLFCQGYLGVELFF